MSLLGDRDGPGRPLGLGDSFDCTGSVPGVVAGTQHTDTATVTGIGATSLAGASDEDDWNGFTAVPPAPAVDIQKYSTIDGPSSVTTTLRRARCRPLGCPKPSASSSPTPSTTPSTTSSSATASDTGPAVTGLSCDFYGLGGPATGVTWAGPFVARRHVHLHRQAAGHGAGHHHADTASATGTGDVSKTPVDSSDEWHVATPPGTTTTTTTTTVAGTTTPVPTATELGSTSTTEPTTVTTPALRVDDGCPCLLTARCAARCAAVAPANVRDPMATPDDTLNTYG